MRGRGGGVRDRLERRDARQDAPAPVLRGRCGGDASDPSHDPLRKEGRVPGAGVHGARRVEIRAPQQEPGPGGAAGRHGADAFARREEPAAAGQQLQAVSDGRRRERGDFRAGIHARRGDAAGLRARARQRPRR